MKFLPEFHPGICPWDQDNSSPKVIACLPQTKPRGAGSYIEGKKETSQYYFCGKPWVRKVLFVSLVSRVLK